MPLAKIGPLRSVWGTSLNAPGRFACPLTTSLRGYDFYCTPTFRQNIGLAQSLHESGLSSADVWLGETLEELEQKCEDRYEVVRGWVASDWTAPCTAIVVYATRTLPGVALSAAAHRLK